MNYSSFWLGCEIGRRTYNVFAHYKDGCVWLGNNDFNRERYADARYKDGCVWLGANDVGLRTYDVTARYKNGCVWLGNNDFNRERYADARYKDGHIWFGSKDIGLYSYNADAQYDGPDDGAAAITVLLLLMKKEAEKILQNESSPNQEVTDSEADEEEDDTNNFSESFSELSVNSQSDTADSTEPAKKCIRNLAPYSSHGSVRLEVRCANLRENFACFGGGCVWAIGCESPTEWTSGKGNYAKAKAVARYQGGYIWLGNEDWNGNNKIFARYKDGYCWNGPEQLFAHQASTRYYDGSIWDSKLSREKNYASYDGSDEGAIAAFMFLMSLYKSDEQLAAEQVEADEGGASISGALEFIFIENLGGVLMFIIVMGVVALIQYFVLVLRDHVF